MCIVGPVESGFQGVGNNCDHLDRVVYVFGPA